MEQERGGFYSRVCLEDTTGKNYKKVFGHYQTTSPKLSKAYTMGPDV